MKLLASVLAASTQAWHSGVCDEGGTIWQESGADIFYCRNTCQFDWIGRGDSAYYKDFGKHENGFLAQMTALKWGIPYLGKENGYVGVLRFDRT